jgi:Amt family ammonium transporter
LWRLAPHLNCNLRILHTANFFISKGSDYMSSEEIMALAEGGVFPVWFLIGAALVFFMNAGFAMLEAGLTRAKNAGNIIMKNVVDFSIGAIAFLLIGYSLMMGQHNGFIGGINFDIFTKFADYATSSSFVFNLVFCATAATIVSGAMAERTKFSAYCLYSVIISAVIYPIEAGWIWNVGGWLAKLGFIDFAGSTAIHMVGGIIALAGASLLGARIGKYDKKGNARAIPGHSITLAALGTFILWFGWYGFNGAAATDKNMLGLIFANTTLAPAFGAVTAMLFTWIKGGKPDISMTLNGALAGLVGITAGCASLDPIGASVVGIVAGILVVAAVEFIDQKIKVDDPVGAVAVHGVNGIWGTLAVGLFATEGGLFYNGGAHLLGIQFLGILAVAAWTAVASSILFLIIKHTIGLRVSKAEEITGLDIYEHGIESSYSGFLFSPSENAIQPSSVSKPSVDTAIPVTYNTSDGGDKSHNGANTGGAKLTKVTIITNQNKFEDLKAAMEEIGITGMTVTQVLGFGMQKGNKEFYRGAPVDTALLPKIQVDVIVAKVPVDVLIKAAKTALYTGSIGDGKIFVYDVENAVKVRTGDEGYDALQDED